jgi:iron complex outermembrane receptor protein
VMAYASWSRGFQAGAFQTFAFASAENSNTPFNETTVDTIEAGFKGKFFDNRVTFNANFFHSDYSDIPSSILSNSGAFEVVTNDARIWGTEFELAAEPVEGLFVYANLSTLNDKYTKSSLAPSQFPGADGDNRL